MAKKKKNQGHYCRICGEYLPNEKFSGKGHAQHVCKVCLSLPQDVQADMERCNEIEKIISKYPMSRQDRELLERYALLYQDKDSGKYAQEILEMKNEIPDSCEVDSLLESFETGDMAFSELEDDIRYEGGEAVGESYQRLHARQELHPRGKALAGNHRMGSEGSV